MNYANPANTLLNWRIIYSYTFFFFFLKIKEDISLSSSHVSQRKMQKAFVLKVLIASGKKNKVLAGVA